MGVDDEFMALEETESRPSRRGRRPGGSGAFWDLLTLFLLVGIVLQGVVFLLIFLNPYIAFNPFPPPPPVPTLFIPTSTPTLRALPQTWTPTGTLTPTETPTPVPPTSTFTPTPTETLPPTETPPVSAYRYLLRGTPVVLSGQVIHPDEGCKLWVAGQAFDLKGSPVVGITVQLGGVLDKPIYLLSLTGTALQYGQGGYEFILAEQAVDSKGSVWVQLLDQEGLPLSPRVTFDTFADCEKNLILVNFKQVR